MEKSIIPTEQKVELLNALSRTGVKNIQVCSFVNPRRVPGMADAEDVVSRMEVNPEVKYSAIWFNEKGLIRARNTGRIEIAGKIRCYPTEVFLNRNLNRTREQHIASTHDEIQMYLSHGIPLTEASVSNAFGCNFEGDVAVEKVLDGLAWIKDLADQYDLDIHAVTLADTMAWATPDKIKRLLGPAQEKYPQYQFGLHLHDTRGMGVANAYAGLEMGVTIFESSVAGLGGCPFAAHKGAAGNVCTEDFVFMCHEMGIETGIDLDALIECALLAEDIVGHPLPGCVMKGGNYRNFGHLN